MTAHGERDRVTVRRGLIAGAVVWAAVSAVLVVNGLVGGLTVGAVPYQVALAAPLGGIVASFWVWLANLLDVLAGERPSRRRWLWALGLTVGTAFALPLVLATSVGVAA